MRKKHLESVQGELNPIYLCPLKLEIPSVGHQKSCFFTSISLIPIFFNYISKNVTKKFIKMKAGLQNRQFSYQFLRFGEMLKFGQNIHKKINCLFFFKQKMHHFEENQKKLPDSGLTVICGSLFSGTFVD